MILPQGQLSCSDGDYYFDWHACTYQGLRPFRVSGPDSSIRRCRKSPISFVRQVSCLERSSITAVTGAGITVDGGGVRLYIRHRGSYENIHECCARSRPGTRNWASNRDAPAGARNSVKWLPCSQKMTTNNAVFDGMDELAPADMQSCAGAPVRQRQGNSNLYEPPRCHNRRHKSRRVRGDSDMIFCMLIRVTIPLAILAGVPPRGSREAFQRCGTASIFSATKIRPANFKTQAPEAMRKPAAEFGQRAGNR